MIIQNKNPFPFTVFPQMPAERGNEMRRQPSKQEEKREKVNPVIAEGISLVSQTISRVEAEPIKKPETVKNRFTNEDVKRGFVMSVILGDPLSRKRYGRR